MAKEYHWSLDEILKLTSQQLFYILQALNNRLIKQKQNLEESVSSPQQNSGFQKNDGSQERNFDLTNDTDSAFLSAKSQGLPFKDI